MVALREYTQIENNTLNLKLPDYFNHKEVEVVIIPRIDKDDLSYLSNEIEIGFNSSLCEKTHEDIFKDLKSKYVH